MEKNRYEDQIDLMELFFALKRRLFVILLTGFLFGAAAFSYSKFVIKPLYTSTSSMLVLTKETTLASLADLQMGSQLTKDYSIMITTRPVLEEVIDNLKLDTDYKSLRAAIAVNNPQDTRILNLSVTSADPKLAKNIVDELAKVSSEFIGDNMEVTPPKIIEEGEISTVKTSPSNRKNAMTGLLFGLALSCGIIVLMTLMDDTIKSEDDIEKYLGSPMLASIPDRKDYVSSGKKKRKGKKK